MRLKTLFFLAASLSIIPSVAVAQNAPPDKDAIVASFKQKIQDVLNTENAVRGPEHASVISTVASAFPGKKKMLHNDGSPCGAFHTGFCHWVWTDDSGAAYTDAAGKLCTGHACVVWTRGYFAAISNYGFDVKQTDSLVTPFTGVLTYTDVFWATAGHATKGRAEKDDKFTASNKSIASNYGYQDGQWNLLK